MSVSSTTSSTTTPGATSGTSASVTTPSTQGISLTDFMELLSEEMSNQDPLQPMDPTQTLTQLAQFTSLQTSGTISQNQSISTAASLIGAEVTIPGTNGNPATTGIVAGIDSSQVATGGAPEVILNGSSTEYPVTSISQIQLAPSSASSSASTSAGGSSSATPPSS